MPTTTQTRLLTAFPLIFIFLLALYFAPAPLWLALVTAVVFAAAVEWGRLAGLKRAGGLVFAGLLSLLGVVAALTAPDQPLPYYPALVFWLLAPWLLARGLLIRAGAAHLLLGVLVLLPTLLALVALRAADAHLLLALVGLVVVADSAAYFSGRRFGRRKLAPGISPGKTWEGVIGAWLAVTVYGVIVLFASGVTCDAICMALALAALWLLFALSVVGDLFESVLKRQAGVKDSGSLLPGHGGVLDRIDSLTAVLPFAVLIWMWWT